jgi:hypothetical protein
MNLNKLVVNAVAAVPSGVRGRVTITKTIRGTLTPSTGARTDTEASFTADCVVVPPKREWIDGSMRLPAYEKTIIIAAGVCTFVPEIGMKATLGTLTWRVTNRTPVNPTGTEDVLYILEVGK